MQPELVTITGLEEAAVLIKNVIAGVAGQTFERGIGVDQDVVLALLLGHHDSVVGGVDYQLQQFGIDHEAGSAMGVAAF